MATGHTTLRRRVSPFTLLYSYSCELAKVRNECGVKSGASGRLTLGH